MLMNQNQVSNSSNSPNVQEANDYVPYVPPASDAPKKEILKLNFSDPFVWLKKGWQDLLSFKSCTTFFGVCFFVMAVVLGIVFRNKPEYTMSIVSGCLLLGPFLALGLYEVSRRNELGLPKSFIQSTTCWRNHIRSMGMLVLVLIVLELLWGRASLVVFAVFFNTGMPSTTGVMEAIFNAQNLEFLLVYAMVGGVFAALVFAVSVVSIPMILDRDTDAISAGYHQHSGGVRQFTSDAAVGCVINRAGSHRPDTRWFGSHRHRPMVGLRHLACLPRQREVVGQGLNFVE